MKTIPLLVAAVVLTSCAANSPEELSVSTTNGAMTQSIRFFGPVNDLYPKQRQNKGTHAVKPIASGNQRHQFPLTQAVQCNRDKNECKHAVVNTWLEFSAQIQANQSIVVRGVLHSEMGRTFSVQTKSSSGYSQSESQTIPESDPLIGEVKSDLPFQKKLKRGEVLELTGVADVQVVLEFQ